MKWTKIIFLMIAGVFMVSIVYGAISDYLELLSNTNECGSICEAELLIKNPFNFDIPINLENARFYFEKNITSLNAYTLYFRNISMYEVNITDWQKICPNLAPNDCYLSNNKSHLTNTTANYWQELAFPFTIKKKSNYTIKIQGSRAFDIRQNNSIDWKINFLSQNPDWAWWNNNWQRCINFSSINNTVGYDIIDYQFNFTVNGTNLTQEGMNSTFPGADFRVVQNFKERPWYNFTNFNRGDVNIMAKINISRANETGVQVCFNNNNAIYPYWNLTDIYSLKAFFDSTDSNSNDWYRRDNEGDVVITNGNIRLNSPGNNKGVAACHKTLNLSTGFFAEFRHDPDDAVNDRPFFIFYHNITNTNQGYSFFFDYSANDPTLMNEPTLNTFALGAVKDYNSGWTLDGTQGNLQTYQLFVEKPNFTSMITRFARLPSGVGNITSNFSVNIIDGSANPSGSVCFGSSDLNVENDYDNLIIYQKINHSQAEDIPYIFQTNILNQNFPNVTIDYPNITVTTNNFLMNVSVRVAQDAVVDYCYYNISVGQTLIVPNTRIFNCATNNSLYETIVTGNANYSIRVFVNDSLGVQNATEFKEFDFRISGGLPYNPGGAIGGGSVPTNIVYNGSFSLEQKTIDRYVIYTDFEGNEQISTVALLTGNRVLNRCETTGQFKCGAIDQNKVPLLLNYKTNNTLTKTIKGTVTVNADTGEVITKQVNVRVIDITLGIKIGSYNLRLLWMLIGSVAIFIFMSLRSPGTVKLRIN